MGLKKGDDLSFSIKDGEALSQVIGQVVDTKDGKHLVAVWPGSVADGKEFDLEGRRVALTWVAKAACKPYAGNRKLGLDDKAFGVLQIKIGSQGTSEVGESTAEDEGPSIQDMFKLMQSASARVEAQTSALSSRLTRVEGEVAAQVPIANVKGKKSKPLAKPFKDSGVDSLAPNLAGLKAKGSSSSGKLLETNLDSGSDDWGSAEDDDEEEIASAEPPAPESTDRMIQLAMLKLLKEFGKEKKKKKTSSSSGSGDSSSGNELQLEGKKGGSFKGVKRLRIRFKKHPKRFTRNYVQMLKEALGVDGTNLPWRVRDINAKLRAIFGRLRGLHRCHGIFCEVLQLQLSEHHDHATALVVQALKCLHQVAVDNGSWTAAEMFLPVGETVDRATWSGEIDEMQAIHSFLKGTKELGSLHKSAMEPTKDQPQVDQDGKPLGKKDKKGKGKGKDDEDGPG